jgi:putative ABC transport system ATP-binding protein
MQPILQVQDIHKSFGDLQIIKGLSFAIQQGESYSIQGPSGCGKSTLFSLLSGMEKPDAGKVFFAETEVQAFNRGQWAKLRGKEMGIVFQDFHLIPSLSVVDNILIVDKILGNKPQLDKAMDSLTKIGLGDRLKHHPHQLSGGEQQRLAILRALHHQPKILFADEPTGSLDEESADKIEEFFFQQVKRESLSLVLITHNPSLAKQCKNQFSMQQGVLQRVD